MILEKKSLKMKKILSQKGEILINLNNITYK